MQSIVNGVRVFYVFFVGVGVRFFFLLRGGFPTIPDPSA